MSKQQEQENRGKVVDNEITLVCDNCGEPVMHYLTEKETEDGEFYCMCPNCGFDATGEVWEDDFNELYYEAVFS